MEFDLVKDSGERETFPTGAVRDIQNGKGRYDLLPPRALRRIAKHYENGALKYGDDNWLKGIPITRMLNSGLRHAFAVLEGKSDEDHLAACVWNFLGIIELQERIEEGLIEREIDDTKKRGGYKQ